MLTVRVATADDGPAVDALESTAWDASSGFPSTLSGTGPAMKDPDDHLVAVLDGEVVGYLRLQPAYPMPEASHVLRCNGLAVAPAARRRGVASALLDAAATEARRRGATKLTLGVFATNTPAIALYEAHGFVQEGRLTGEFLINGTLVDDLAMALHLT